MDPDPVMHAVKALIDAAAARRSRALSGAQMIAPLGKCPTSNGNGAPDWIRTSGPQIRNLMLYPAELRARPAPALRIEPFFGKRNQPFLMQGAERAGTGGHTGSHNGGHAASSARSRRDPIDVQPCSPWLMG